MKERYSLDISLDLKNPISKVQQTSSYFIAIQHITFVQSPDYKDLCTIEFNNRNHSVNGNDLIFHQKGKTPERWVSVPESG